MSDEGSVLGDLSDMVSHGLQAGADVLAGEGYTLQAGGEAAVGAAAHVFGGLEEAVGADGSDARAFGDHWQDEASSSIHQAGREFSDAGEQLVGGAELPDLPELPPVSWGPNELAADMSGAADAGYGDSGYGDSGYGEAGYGDQEAEY